MSRPRSLLTLLPLVASLSLVAGATGCAGAQKSHASIARQAEHLRVELAETYIEKGALEAAIPLLRRMLEDDPEDLHVRTLYATVLRDMGLFGQAENQFRVVLARAPRLVAAHAGIAVTYDLQRKSARARRHHERALAIAPDVAPLHNNLGFSLYLAGDYRGAARQLERALELDPGLAVAYNNLGFAYGRLGRLDDAERSFRAVGSEPTTLLNLSIVLTDAGDDAGAEALRARAYSLSPELRPSPTSPRRNSWPASRHGAAPRGSVRSATPPASPPPAASAPATPSPEVVP